MFRNTFESSFRDQHAKIYLGHVGFRLLNLILLQKPVKTEDGRDMPKGSDLGHTMQRNLTFFCNFCKRKYSNTFTQYPLNDICCRILIVIVIEIIETKITLFGTRFHFTTTQCQALVKFRLTFEVANLVHLIFL